MLSKKSVLGVVLGLLVLTISVQAQTFEKTYHWGSQDYGYSAVEDSEGYIIAGSVYVDTFTLSDIGVFKINLEGDTVWSRTYKFYDEWRCSEIGYAIQKTNNGYAIAGFVVRQSIQAAEGFFLEIDSQGKILRKQISPSPLWDLTCNGIECVAVGRPQKSDSNGVFYIYLVKINSNDGNIIWEKSWCRGLSYVSGMSIRPSSRGYIIGGTVLNILEPGSEADLFLLAVSTEGDSLWSQTYSRSGWESQPSVDLDKDGQIFIAATTNPEPYTDAAILLIKTDSLGGQIWSRTYGGEKSDGGGLGKHMVCTGDGSVLITGNTQSFDSLGISELYLLKINPINGDTIWTRRFNKGSKEWGAQGFSVLETSDNYYLVTGTILLDSTAFDVYSIKVTKEGLLTDVSEPREPNLPQKFALYQNYPNPFNSFTTISFDLPRDFDVKLVIYNILGQKVKTLVDGRQLAGSQKVIWDGKDNSGREVASGIYFYRIQAGSFVKTAKMTLLK